MNLNLDLKPMIQVSYDGGTQIFPLWWVVVVAVAEGKHSKKISLFCVGLAYNSHKIDA